jgi:hypothetical protein
MGDLTDTQADMVSDNYTFTYVPQDAIQKALDATKLTGGAGLLVAAVQNTLLRENIGAFGVFTRFGSTVALFGMAHNTTRACTGLTDSQLEWAVHMHL